SGCAGDSTPTGSPTPGRSSRRRASAARCRARTAHTRSSGQALPSVSSPSSVGDAAAAFRHAAAEGRRVSIDREGGDVVLRTAGLDRIVEHEAGDLTCTVEAGIRLSVLNERLAEHGQMLALDPPGDPTVGACLAGDLS